MVAFNFEMGFSKSVRAIISEMSIIFPAMRTVEAGSNLRISENYQYGPLTLIKLPVRALHFPPGLEDLGWFVSGVHTSFES